MEFFDTIRQVKNNWQPYKKWEIEQQKKESENEQLRKDYPPTQQDLANAKQYGRTIVDVINTMDQHSIDKSEDASLIVGTYGMFLEGIALALFKPLNDLFNKIPIGKLEHNPNKKLCVGLITAFVEVEVLSSVLNILKAKYEKQASRIARYQTRERDLKDYRSFVVYNKEQIEEAQEIAKTLPDVKEKTKIRKKGFHPVEDYKNAQKTVNVLAKDNKNYEKWKENYQKEEAIKKEQFKTLNPPQSELDKAEKDRDSLLSTIKKIEFSSLSYLNNMSMVLATAITGVVIGAFFVGHGLNKILDKFIPKLKFIETNPLLLKSIRGFNLTALPLFAPAILLSTTVKMLKDSARVGRFKAKQELLNNPENFVAYDDEKRKNVSANANCNIKQKTFFQKLMTDFDEVKNFKKDYAQYSAYMKTQHKEELKLDEALKQVEITEEQKNEAIELQKKAFHSFEKMDEKAQRFTDDTDAGVDIAGRLAMGLITCAFRVNGVIKGNDLFDKTKLLSSNRMLKKTLPFFVLPQLAYPFVKAIATRIKKDAGQIGVMTAMKDMEDPKFFLDDKTFKESEKQNKSLKEEAIYE